MLAVSCVCAHYLARSRWNEALDGALLPGFGWQAIVDALHGDAVFDRTDERAKIAADTVMFIHARNALEWRHCAAVTQGARVEFGNRRGGDVTRRFGFNHRRGS